MLTLKRFVRLFGFSLEYQRCLNSFWIINFREEFLLLDILNAMTHEEGEYLVVIVKYASILCQLLTLHSAKFCSRHLNIEEF